MVKNHAEAADASVVNLVDDHGLTRHLRHAGLIVEEVVTPYFRRLIEQLHGRVAFGEL